MSNPKYLTNRLLVISTTKMLKPLHTIGQQDICNGKNRFSTSGYKSSCYFFFESKDNKSSGVVFNSSAKMATS